MHRFMFAVATFAVASVASAACPDTDFLDYSAKYGYVVSPKAGTFYERRVATPTVSYNEITGEYLMLFSTLLPDADYKIGDYASCSNGGVWGLGRATSTDGVNWDVDDSAPAILPEANTAHWCATAHPTMVYDKTDGKNGTYHVWYKAEQIPGYCGSNPTP
ncbi:MAG: hypothetical protein HN348_22405, partial [Proteobacteria bacterium]|nr:hypothetical protein [Pseudomonadota bacterium]